MINIKIGEIEIRTDNINEAVGLMKLLKEEKKVVKERPIMAKITRIRGRHLTRSKWNQLELRELLNNMNLTPKKLVKFPALSQHTKGGISNMLWLIRNIHKVGPKRISPENKEFVLSFYRNLVPAGYQGAMPQRLPIVSN